MAIPASIMTATGATDAMTGAAGIAGGAGPTGATGTAAAMAGAIIAVAIGSGAITTAFAAAGRAATFRDTFAGGAT